MGQRRPNTKPTNIIGGRGLRASSRRLVLSKARDLIGWFGHSSSSLKFSLRDALISRQESCQQSWRRERWWSQNFIGSGSGDAAPSRRLEQKCKVPWNRISFILKLRSLISYRVQICKCVPVASTATKQIYVRYLSCNDRCLIIRRRGEGWIRWGGECGGCGGGGHAQQIGH